MRAADAQCNSCAAELGGPPACVACEWCRRLMCPHDRAVSLQSAGARQRYRVKLCPDCVSDVDREPCAPNAVLCAGCAAKQGKTPPAAACAWCRARLEGCVKCRSAPRVPLPSDKCQVRGCKRPACLGAAKPSQDPPPLVGLPLCSHPGCQAVLELGKVCCRHATAASDPAGPLDESERSAVKEYLKYLPTAAFASVLRSKNSRACACTACWKLYCRVHWAAYCSRCVTHRLLPALVAAAGGVVDLGLLLLEYAMPLSKDQRHHINCDFLSQVHPHL